jgi:hypothetical protein
MPVIRGVSRDKHARSRGGGRCPQVAPARHIGVVPTASMITDAAVSLVWFWKSTAHHYLRMLYDMVATGISRSG